MRNHVFADLDWVVVLGDGYDLGRAMPSLSSLSSRLTGIVTTTNNGGSTRQVRRSEGGIVQGDIRNRINQLIAEPSVASAMFKYRFNGNGELSRRDLGNLILEVLDRLSMRPLETINLIRNLLRVDVLLTPISEQPVDSMTLDHEGHEVYGEVNIGQLDNLPQELMLTPPVSATRETVEVIARVDLILVSPGSFYAGLLPILLLDEAAQALRRTPAPMILTDNLSKEHSPAARLSLAERTTIMERYVGKQMVDAVIAEPKADVRGINGRLMIQMPLEASDVPYRHDRTLLRDVLEEAIQLPGRRCAPEGRPSVRLKILGLS